jgi:hypothetical protein
MATAGGAVTTEDTENLLLECKNAGLLLEPTVSIGNSTALVQPIPQAQAMGYGCAALLPGKATATPESLQIQKG